MELSSLTTTQTPAAAVASTGAKIRSATFGDLKGIRSLHERAFGPGRYALTAYRVREGTPSVSSYCQVAFLDDKLVGAIRFTPILIGGKPDAVLLGPLAVEPRHVNTGIGRELVSAGVKAAAADGARLVVLVGDVNYYKRFGFAPVPLGQIHMPGPVNPARIMALETVPGALSEYRGLIEAA